MGYESYARAVAAAFALSLAGVPASFASPAYVVTPVVIPGATNVVPTAISDRRVIVGTYATAGVQTLPFVDDHGSISQLPMPQGDFNPYSPPTPIAISPNNTIVALSASTVFEGDVIAATYNGQMHQISYVTVGTTSCCYAYLENITANHAGMILWATNVYRPFPSIIYTDWYDSQTKKGSSLPNNYAGQSINYGGQISGTYYPYGFVSSPSNAGGTSSIQQFAPPQSTQVISAFINDQGVVVGSFRDTNGFSNVYLKRGGSFFNLFESRENVTYTVYGINNRQDVAVAKLANGLVTLVMLTLHGRVMVDHWQASSVPTVVGMNKFGDLVYNSATGARLASCSGC